MKTVIIDGNDIISMSEIHRIFAGELCFPEYYGKNLDALYDCLGEIGEETEICVLNKDQLIEKLGISFDRLCRLLTDVSEDNQMIKLSI